MKIPFSTEYGKVSGEIDISDIPHLGACFDYQEKYYKIVQVNTNKEKEIFTYKLVVKAVGRP